MAGIGFQEGLLKSPNIARIAFRDFKDHGICMNPMPLAYMLYSNSGCRADSKVIRLES